jgi:exosortase/archaeosortase family protein
LALTGQGLLVATGVLGHEAPLWIALLLLLAGAVLIAWPALRGAPDPDAKPAARPSRLRAGAVAALGATAAGGVLAYNVAASSSFTAPEIAILVYGLALLVASTRLQAKVAGVPVGTLVAYSFPLALAPLGLFAVNAAITTWGDSPAMQWYVRDLLVAPMSALLQLGGMDATALGTTVRLATPRGPLFLTVGTVCAGLYASVLFLGLFGLFAWQARTPPPRLAAYLTLGLVGLHVANIARLVLLAVVGEAWGGVALQQFHQHAGWALFLAWMVLFWALVLRRFEGPARPRLTG